MKIDRRHLDDAAERGIISADQSKALWEFLRAEQADVPRFSLNHLLYYFGGLIAIGGISFYVTLGWEMLGGAGIFVITVAVMAGAAALTEYFLVRQKLAIPAGLMAALIVAAAPLAIYGLQQWMGLWPATDNTTSYRQYHTLIDLRWIVMEIGTLVVGAIVLWRWRLPFSVMPIALTLWYMSMDLAPLLQSILTKAATNADPAQSAAQQSLLSNSYWIIRQWVSVTVGLLMIAVAFSVDLGSRGRRDFGFWLHLAGVAAFWGGLSSMNSSSEIGKLIYFLLNVFMLLLGAAVGRRVYTVFGAFGIAAYLGHLSYKVFANSLLFPLVLVGIGLGVIWLGVLWQRNERAITSFSRRYLPERLRTLAE